MRPSSPRSRWFDGRRNEERGIEFCTESLFVARAGWALGVLHPPWMTHSLPLLSRRSLPCVPFSWSALLLPPSCTLASSAFRMPQPPSFSSRICAALPAVP